MYLTYHLITHNNNNKKVIEAKHLALDGLKVMASVCVVKMQNGVQSFMTTPTDVPDPMWNCDLTLYVTKSIIHVYV